MNGSELERDRRIKSWMDCAGDRCTDGRTDGWMNG
jgi:hypothetical protein